MRMTEPLPNWRSIWVRAPCRAVSLAFAGSWMLMPSTLGRGSDRRQHANVTKACRLCAKCVEGVLTVAHGARVPTRDMTGCRLSARQRRQTEAQRRVAEPTGLRGQPDGDAAPVEAPGQAAASLEHERSVRSLGSGEPQRQLAPHVAAAADRDAVDRLEVVERDARAAQLPRAAAQAAAGGGERDGRDQQVDVLEGAEQRAQRAADLAGVAGDAA